MKSFFNHKNKPRNKIKSGDDKVADSKNFKNENVEDNLDGAIELDDFAIEYRPLSNNTLNLPNEMFQNVLSKLDDNSLKVVSSVCSLFHSNARAEFKQRLKFKNLGDAFENYEKSFSTLSEVKKFLLQIELNYKAWLEQEPDLSLKQNMHTILLLQLFNVMVFFQKKLKKVHFENVRTVHYQPSATALMASRGYAGPSTFTECESIKNEDYDKLKTEFKAAALDPIELRQFNLNLIEKIEALFKNNEGNPIDRKLMSKGVKELIRNLQNNFIRLKNSQSQGPLEKPMEHNLIPRP